MADGGKSNPYILKPIRKNLLTPCRQVGLRKKKTPTSIDKLLNKNDDSPLPGNKQQSNGKGTLEESVITPKTGNDKTFSSNANVKKDLRAKIEQCDNSPDTRKIPIKASKDLAKLEAKSERITNNDKSGKEIDNKKRNSSSSEELIEVAKLNEENNVKNKSSGDDNKISKNGNDNKTLKRNKSRQSVETDLLSDDDDFAIGSNRKAKENKSTKVLSDRNEDEVAPVKRRRKMVIEDESRSQESQEQEIIPEKAPSSLNNKNDSNIEIREPSKQRIGDLSETKKKDKNNIFELSSKKPKINTQASFDDSDDEVLEVKKQKQLVVKTYSRPKAEDTPKTELREINSKPETNIKNNKNQNSDSLEDKNLDTIDLTDSPPNKKTNLNLLPKKENLTNRQSIEPVQVTENSKKNRKSLIRCLSLKSTYDDLEESDSSPEKGQVKQCSIRLNSSEIKKYLEKETQKLPSNISKDDVAKLEDIVNNKKQLLRQLKQAEIYKSLHKVDELYSLTDQWKEGCKKALEDLKSLLETNNTVDMEFLLNSLKIPSHILD